MTRPHPSPRGRPRARSTDPKETDPCTIAFQNQPLPKRLKGFTAFDPSSSDEDDEEDEEEEESTSSAARPAPSTVLVPTFRPVPSSSLTKLTSPSKTKSTGSAKKSLSAASGLEKSLVAHSVTRQSDYDVDSEDEGFVTRAKISTLTIDVLEKVFTSLEREFRVASHKSKEEARRDRIQRHTTAAVARAQALLDQLRATSSSSLSAREVEKKMSAAEQKALSACAKTKSNEETASSIEGLVPESRVLALHPELPKDTARRVYRYWLTKRKETGSCLLVFSEQDIVAQLEEDPGVLPPVSSIIDPSQVVERLRAVRENLERVRLVADSTRRREKMKKECLRLQGEDDLVGAMAG